jgi:hypothetical protein
MIVLDVGVNDNARRLDFFVRAGIRSCFQLESNLFGEVIDSLFNVCSDNLDEVVGCGFQVVGGYEVGAKWWEAMKSEPSRILMVGVMESMALAVLVAAAFMVLAISWTWAR